MDVGWVAPGLPLLHLKGMRVMMFQLSGFYFRGLGISLGFKGSGASGFRDSTDRSPRPVPSNGGLAEGRWRV